MAVYGYVRVSTDRQADEGVSLPQQERALLGYAMQHGMELGRVFVEQGVSGSTPMASALKASSCSPCSGPATWC